MNPLYGDLEANSSFVFTLACILAGEHIGIDNESIHIKKTQRPEILLIEKVINKENSKEVITKLLGDENHDRTYSFPIITKKQRMSASEIATAWNTMMLKNASKLSSTGINFFGVPLEEINSLSSKNFYFMIDKKKYARIKKIAKALEKCFQENKIITISGNDVELTRGIADIKDITLPKDYPYTDAVRGIFYMLRFISDDDIEPYIEALTRIQVAVDKDMIMDVEASAFLIFVSVLKLIAFLPLWHLIVKNTDINIENNIDAPSMKSFIEKCIYSYIIYMNLITETVKLDSKIIELGNSFGYLD